VNKNWCYVLLIGQVGQRHVMDGCGMQNKHWMSSQKTPLLRLVTI